jgi:phospholipid/cholesterol/gamma-HCH transport system ATP-binding protein
MTEPCLFKPNPIDLAPLEIQIENLWKAFGTRTVLQGIDLEIHRGEVVAIVGGSGCGKTVLLNHVLGLLSPDRGHVRVADHGQADAPLVEMGGMTPSERDSVHVHWGMVFQRNALFSGSVLENIALWLREVRHLEDEAIVPIARHALSAVGLPRDDEFLNSDHENLSGGMAKRLAVARAVSMDPAVVFFDEPTTGLDPTSSAQIHELIFATHHEQRPGRAVRTTLIITHDKDLLSRMRPRTVMLHEGRVFFDGSFDEFRKSASPIITPYFEMMPVLHQRPAVAAET